MNKVILTILSILILIAKPVSVSAHCPLCTAGAGALAVFSSWLGVSTATVGVFLGAFALALGLWLARLIPTKYFTGQDLVVIVATVLVTLWPISPLIREYRPLYIAWGGEYGSLMHNTYTLDLFVVGALIGLVISILAPIFSRYLTRLAGRRLWPFQSLSLTLGLLLLAGIILQLSL